jgi:hypothetical protein
MKIILQIGTFIVWTFLLGCNNHSTETKNASPKGGTVSISSKLPEPLDTPRSFVRNYGASDNNKLFAFVGQKICVEPLPSRKYSFDYGFKAKYLILEKVFGDFLTDTIEFVAYDHSGIPPFSKFENVLLYVSADSGTYYQQKYMYNDVYKTADGRWAGTYVWDDYEHENNKRARIKPIKIEFAEPVFYPLKMINDEGYTFSRKLPKPYFKTVGDTAFALYGNYVKDLFILKRNGYLTAREIFKNGKLNR